MTIQCNVRVPPEDVELLKRIAAKLRDDREFRDRLDKLLNEPDVGPAVIQRIERLEGIIADWQERIVWLQQAPGATPRGDQ